MLPREFQLLYLATFAQMLWRPTAICGCCVWYQAFSQFMFTTKDCHIIFNIPSQASPWHANANVWKGVWHKMILFGSRRHHFICQETHFLKKVLKYKIRYTFSLCLKKRLPNMQKPFVWRAVWYRIIFMTPGTKRYHFICQETHFLEVILL